MADFSSWIRDNWSNLIGATGIIGSLWFTAINIGEDCKARQVANLLALDERHRDLWSEIQQSQSLKRLLAETADLTAEPMTAAEELYLRRIMVHFETGWRLERIMNRGEMQLLARDVGETFSLPLPRAMWEKTKEFRNPKFVRFVERALKKAK
jgi:hypothetical protein